MSAGTTDVALGDLSGDGQADVAVANASDSTVTWRVNEGDASFGNEQLIGISGGARTLALGDLDTDGDLDVASGGPASNFLDVHTNEGGGSFQFSSVLAGRSPTDIVIADLNGDARPDIAASEDEQSDVAVVLQSEHGTFGWPQFFGAGRNTQSLAAGDFDRDGNPDLASADQWGKTLTVFLNQSRWSDAGPGLAGTHGVPHLGGSGPLLAGAPVQGTLTSALENSTATLVIGLSQIAAPFKGGVLGPAVDALVPGLPTGAKGELALPATWPAGLASGFTLWLQVWISDAAAAKGLAASNTLAAEVP
jgi:hypothetical protein